MIDSHRLNQILIEIDRQIATGIPSSEYQNLNAEELEAWHEIYAEVKELKDKGIAIDVPGEWPDF